KPGGAEHGRSGQTSGAHTAAAAGGRRRLGILSATHARRNPERTVTANVNANVNAVNEWRCNMFKSLDIQKGMEVVGLDSKHVGTIDHLETANRIVLSKDDPKAGGKQHLISIDWVDYVDQKVHLNKPSIKATSEWQAAA